MHPALTPGDPERDLCAVFAPRDAHRTGRKGRSVVAHACLQRVARGGAWDPEALVLALGTTEPISGAAAA